MSRLDIRIYYGQYKYGWMKTDFWVSKIGGPVSLELL